jgi:uncharacterized protein YggE
MTSGSVVRTAAILALLSTPAFAQETPARPTISTPGEASVKQAPDRAWVTLAVDAHASKSDDARRMGAQAMTDVQAALKATGLPADAIRTLAYSLQPENRYADGRQTVIGYIAHNQIEVRVDDLDKLPAVLDAATTPKNVTLSIGDPRFDLKNRESVEREMLARAVDNALARARAIAGGAGLTLGPIVHIENQTAPVYTPGPIMRTMAVGGTAAGGQIPSTPITPGEIEVRANVLLTVAIAPGRQ